MQLRGFLLFLALLLSSDALEAEPLWWKLIHWAGDSLQQSPGSWGLNLRRKQARLIRKEPELVKILSEALKGAGKECQHFFAQHEWDCAVGEETPVFGPVGGRPYKESAFLHALISGSGVRAIARACARGDLSLCSCDSRRRGPSGDGWYWSGCSDNVPYAVRLARRWMNEPGKDLKTAIDAHNQEAGRLQARLSTKTACRCRGRFASCTERLCTRRLGSLRAISGALFARLPYAERVDNATAIGLPELMAVDRKGRRRRALSRAGGKGPKREDLVYLEEWEKGGCEAESSGSPCSRWNGTEVEGEGGLCKERCCQGYYHRPVMRPAPCNCSFVWCCSVKCQTCMERAKQFFCL